MRDRNATKKMVLSLVKELDEIKRILSYVKLRNLHAQECELRRRIKSELKRIEKDEELRELLNSCPTQNEYELLATIMMEAKGPVRTLEIENEILTVSRILSGEW
jgi:hypothetical protein